MNRIVLHIDMNSYFASVEQQANPHLRGRPVGVCEHLGGIIIAPSVEAKRLGIKLGTPVWTAQKIFPQIVLLPTDPDKYRHITKKFLDILQDYSDDVEQYSIDEAFVDITEYCCGDYEEALLLGLEIKQRMRLEVAEWVSCSIGIGPNKLVAKIAADLDGGVINFVGCHSEAYSPKNLEILRGYPQDDKSFLDRICVVRPEQVGSLYEKLKLTDAPGIGPRLERALQKLGIFSLRALAVYPLENLLNQFGINGYVLHSLANFNTMTSPVSPPREEGLGEVPDFPKSFGHAYTVPKALTRIGEIKKLMFKLAEKVGRRMRQHGARGSVVHYFHSDKQGNGFSKQCRIRDFINDGKDIFKIAWQIYQNHNPPYPSLSLREGVPPLRVRGGERELRIKIMGVSVSGLQFESLQQDFLFEQYKRPLWLIRAMDKINDKYGEYTITRGQMHGAPPEWAKDTVGFSRVRN